MRYVYLLLFLLLSTTTSAIAQYGQTRKGPILVHLQNGDTLFTNYVKIQNFGTLFRASHLEIGQGQNRQRVSMRNIQALEGFDSKLNRYRYFLHVPDYNAVAERDFSSERIQTFYFHKAYMNGTDTKVYFKKDNGPLTRMTSQSLKVAVQDDPDAWATYKKSRTLLGIELGLYALGALCIYKGFQEVANTPNEPGNFSKEPNVLPYMVGAAVAFGINWPIRNAKKDLMRQSLHIYR